MGNMKWQAGPPTTEHPEDMLAKEATKSIQVDLSQAHIKIAKLQDLSRQQDAKLAFLEGLIERVIDRLIDRI